MPCLKSRPPRRTRNRKTAVVYIDGQAIRFGRCGSPEAQENYDRLIAEWLTNGWRLPEPTVTEVCVAYVRHTEKRYTRSEADTIRRAIRHVRRLYGSESVESFGPVRFRAVRQSMIDAGWSRAHINKQASRIH